MGNDDDRRSKSPVELELIDSAWDDEASGEIAIGRNAPALGSFDHRQTAPPPGSADDYVQQAMRLADAAEAAEGSEQKSGPRPKSSEPDLELDLEPGLPPIVTPDTLPAAVLDFDDPLANLRPPSVDDLSLDLGPTGAPDPMELGMNEDPVEILEPDLDTPTGAPPEDPAVTGMRDRYAAGDFTGALVIAESLLDGDPEHEEAIRYAASCRDVLTQMYAARLGSLDRAVSVAIPGDQIRWLSLDHRSGFLLSLIDGTSTVEEILDICGMTRLDALRIMYTLLEQRIIALETG